MSTTFFKVAAYGTLVVDAYLALAAVATRVDVRDLPPFGSEPVTDCTRLVVLLVATWTAILAVGCLGTGTGRSERTQTPVVFWFVLVLGLVWLGFLLPWLTDTFWRLFVQGW